MGMNNTDGATQLSVHIYNSVALAVSLCHPMCVLPATHCLCELLVRLAHACPTLVSCTELHLYVMYVSMYYQ